MTDEKDRPKSTGKPATALSRRAALAKLGLGTAVAYSAPVILHLDREAHAIIPTPCPPRGRGGGGGPPMCRRRKRGSPRGGSGADDGRRIDRRGSSSGSD